MISYAVFGRTGRSGDRNRDRTPHRHAQRVLVPYHWPAQGVGTGGADLGFVVKKDVEQNILYVSHGYDTLLQYGHSFNLKDFHFITENPWGDAPEVDVTFKTRHQPHFMKGRLHRAGHGYRLESPERIQG